MADLERQGISAMQPAEQYGAIDPKKGSADERLPLLLGRWEVSPKQLYTVGLACYVTWFIIHRMAELAYIFTVDARFPEGLGHLYPTESQRLESVAYTQQVLLCGMLHRIVVFCVVLTFVVFQLFARMDTALRSFFAAVGTWWESENYVRIGCGCCCGPIWRCLCYCVPTWCSNLKHRTLNGVLATDLTNRFGFPCSFKELLIGSVYLTLMSALFFMLSTPFLYWMQMIDLKFGFANSLTVSAPNFRQMFFLGTLSILLFTVPKKLMFLVVLQYRAGWALMWGGLMLAVVYAQFNVGLIAPMLGLDKQFPTSNFAVARGFPLIETTNAKAPWISLNRLFFPDKFSQSIGVEPDTFYTQDKSKGSLALAHQPSGDWSISGTAWFDPAATVYAKTSGAASTMEGLKDLSWSGGDAQTRMGVRSGKELRDKLFGFSRARHIGIGEIYMVDGSHRDARANAFVTGAGNHSIIGLYDTLFLGKRGKEASEDADDDEADLANSESLVQHVSDLVQGVNVEEEDNDKRAPRNSAPTQAMNDDEIVAILAHELAHSAMKHMEMGMVTQVFTSFVTFASLGWMAHSPLAAAALSLSTPMLHVGVCAYDNVVGPPIEGFMKLFTDGLTRHNEYEADAYATRISERYGTGLQTALAKLSVNSNQDPDPPWFFEALHSDHPPFARRWAHIEDVKKRTYGDKKKP